MTSELDAGGGTTWASYSYSSYDNDNRLQAEVYNDGNTLGSQTTSYTYTADGQLATETGTGAVSYSNGNTYDNNGNRTGSPIYDLGSNEISGASSDSYLYDPDGNRLVTYVGGTVYNDYAFDTRNRLTNIWAPDAGQSITYTYNPQNQRIQETDYTSTSTVYTAFAYDPGGDLRMQLNSSGVATDLYLPDPTGGVAPLGHEDSSGNYTWLLTTDQNGSVQDVIAQTQRTGALTCSDRVLFDSFGNKKITDTGTPSLFGFQGCSRTSAISAVTHLDYDNALV